MLVVLGVWLVLRRRLLILLVLVVVFPTIGTIVIVLRITHGDIKSPSEKGGLCGFKKNTNGLKSQVGVRKKEKRLKEKGIVLTLQKTNWMGTVGLNKNLKLKIYSKRIKSIRIKSDKNRRRKSEGEEKEKNLKEETARSPF